MHVVDALFVIAFFAWLTDVVPGWVVIVAFAIMVFHEADKEEADGQAGE